MQADSHGTAGRRLLAQRSRAQHTARMLSVPAATKVTDLELALAGYKQVLRLDVTMDHLHQHVTHTAGQHERHIAWRREERHKRGKQHKQ